MSTGDAVGNISIRCGVVGNIVDSQSTASGSIPGNGSWHGSEAVKREWFRPISSGFAGSNPARVFLAFIAQLVEHATFI